MTKADQAIIKNLIHEAFEGHRERNCRPHEDRIEQNERLLDQVFANGLKADVKEMKEDVKEMKKEVNDVRKRWWIMPLAMVGSVFATYFVDKLF